MQKAGWQGDPLFSDEAIQAVHTYTQGIPRKINTFLDRVLLFAFLEDIEKVDAEAIQAVINEVSGELNHQDDPHAQMEVTETATGTKLRRKKQSSKVDLDDLTGDMSESELLALTSGLSGEMSTAKMESLLESILLMQKRSVILQSQILKELKEKE
jgi:hypothetical protein